jgi:hypothetical protein
MFRCSWFWTFHGAIRRNPGLNTMMVNFWGEGESIGPPDFLFFDIKFYHGKRLPCQSEVSGLFYPTGLDHFSSLDLAINLACSCMWHSSAASRCSERGCCCPTPSSLGPSSSPRSPRRGSMLLEAVRHYLADRHIGFFSHNFFGLNSHSCYSLTFESWTPDTVVTCQ